MESRHLFWHTFYQAAAILLGFGAPILVVLFTGLLSMVALTHWSQEREIALRYEHEERMQALRVQEEQARSSRYRQAS
jgi:hypothetical protein